MNRRTAPIRRGFTLVELLVVMAIIAILSAILFPVFVQAKNAARKTACLSNMRQVGLGLTMYQNEFDDMLPVYRDGVSYFNEPEAAPNFLGSLKPYTRQSAMGGIYVCDRATQDPNNPCGRASCTSFLGNGVVMGKSAAQIPFPAETIYLQEFLLQTNRAWLRPNAVGNGFSQWHNNTFGVPGQQRYSALHDEGGNLTFSDGHVKFWRSKGIHSGMFGLTPDLPVSAPTNYYYTAAF